MSIQQDLKVALSNLVNVRLLADSGRRQFSVRWPEGETSDFMPFEKIKETLSERQEHLQAVASPEVTVPESFVSFIETYGYPAFLGNLSGVVNRTKVSFGKKIPFMTVNAQSLLYPTHKNLTKNRLIGSDGLTEPGLRLPAQVKTHAWQTIDSIETAPGERLWVYLAPWEPTCVPVAGTFTDLVLATLFGFTEHMTTTDSRILKAFQKRGLSGEPLDLARETLKRLLANLKSLNKKQLLSIRHGNVSCGYIKPPKSKTTVLLFEPKNIKSGAKFCKIAGFKKGLSHTLVHPSDHPTKFLFSFYFKIEIIHKIGLSFFTFFGWSGKITNSSNKPFKKIVMRQAK